MLESRSDHRQAEGLVPGRGCFEPAGAGELGDLEWAARTEYFAADSGAVASCGRLAAAGLDRLQWSGAKRSGTFDLSRERLLYPAFDRSIGLRRFQARSSTI